MRDIFAAKQVSQGGIVRRKVRDIENYAGRAVFEAELRHRGFHAVKNAGHLIIFCNQEPIRFVL
tara:strand:+ start:561 stop:752 length:192 start_codon:yes stop_codon:yes gene_type:complete